MDKERFFIYAMDDRGRYYPRIVVVGIDMAIMLLRQYVAYVPEIRVTDGGDLLVIHARNGVILFPENLAGEPGFALRMHNPDLLDEFDNSPDDAIARTLAEFLGCQQQLLDGQCDWSEVAVRELHLQALGLMHSLDLLQAGYEPTWGCDNLMSALNNRS